MINVISWMFWLSLAVILLSELKFWDVLRGESKPKDEKHETHAGTETKDS